MLSNPLTSRLRYFEIDDSILGDYQILCLPENFFSDEMEELYDADHAVNLGKKLKQTDIKCANSYDLGLEPDIYFRKSAELFFGIVYVLEKAVIPVLASVLSTLLVLKITGNGEKSEEQNSSHVNIELYLPEEKHLKYDGDSETLLKILNDMEEG
ncbi:hypothetical protein HNV12_22645 [Methanococcoides sp. SA1]|nr:hypothetical protein [Methanococcoides sp. SA1]